MRVLRFSDPGFEDQVRELGAASSLFDPDIEARTRLLIEGVRTRGDDALIEFTERFDGAKLSAAQLAVTHAEFMSASLEADDELRRAVDLSGRNIERFSRRSLRKRWWGLNAQGAKVGEKFDPLQRVGIYIPGGTAPLVSTALMTVNSLARVAGCKEIVVCTPCGPEGRVSSALLFAVRAAGATEVYRLGGAQAIAAMALGTASIRRVHKVFGPGNAYVVAAKRLLFGHVAVDLLPGPSEVLVLADETANARFAASDLLAQAEHGSGHERVWLVTPSAKVLRAVQTELLRQLPSLTRRAFIERALARSGCLIQTRSLDAGIAVVNALAPEHCEILTRNPARVADKILTAGAIFLGGYSPTVLGDYVAGPSHELPTGGAGASFAGLTVDQFQRRTSVVQYDLASLRKSLPAVRTFAKVEGLDAHGRSGDAARASMKPPKSKVPAARPRGLAGPPPRCTPVGWPEGLIRPAIQRATAYVPGEQLKVRGLVKLNTNENPYPPSPRVCAAIKAAVDSRLRLYPNPTAQPLRQRLARLHGCAAENIIVGNGSDELLAMATRAFVEPHPEAAGAPGLCVEPDSARKIQYFHPSYSLYPVLADIHGAIAHPVALNKDFSMPPLEELERTGRWDFAAALTFVTTPNAPSGRGYALSELLPFCQRQRGVLVLDEAYVDFAREHAMELALRYPHVLVARTFSKAYSLCFQRVGYFVGHPALIGALDKIRDSYNVNGLGQIAALETLKDLGYYRANFRRVIRTRERLTRALSGLGFEVLPSQTNFLLVRPPGLAAARWFEALRRHKILVRWFNAPGISEYLRISVGSEDDTDALLRAVRRILDRGSSRSR